MLKKKVRISGYLTVYLALIMGVLISLCLVLIEAVRKNTVALEAECVTDIAINSVMAEYHKELFRQYNLFAIDSSYGTPYASVKNTERHLKMYIEENLSQEDIFLSDFVYKDFLALEVARGNGVEVTGVSILTDGQGAVFRRLAVDAVKDDVGIGLMEELIEWVELVKAEEMQYSDISWQMEQLENEVQTIVSQKEEMQEMEWNATEVANPMENVNCLRRKGILETVIANPEKLSSKGIDQKILIGERKKQGSISCGNIPVKSLTVEETMLERFLFQEYLLRYMGYYGKQKENGALDYQLEYLLTGKSNDIENLKSTANRLCMLRGAANGIYLFSDKEKCAEAEAVGTLLAALLQLPGTEKIFQAAILTGWAYAESVYDVKVLLSGGKIPLLKTYDTWHYDLDAVLAMNAVEEGRDTLMGLSYEDYLRIFMMLMDLDVLTERAMNMIEADVRMTPGNGAFRLDGCCDGFIVHVKMESAYGYEYSLDKQRYYSLY